MALSVTFIDAMIQGIEIDVRQQRRTERSEIAKGRSLCPQGSAGGRWQITPPCGVPCRLGVTFLFPSLLSSTMGARSQPLLNDRMLPSLTRRATSLSNSRCGIVSKNFDKSASSTSTRPVWTAARIASIACCARRFGRNP